MNDLNNIPDTAHLNVVLITKYIHFNVDDLSVKNRNSTRPF